MKKLKLLAFAALISLSCSGLQIHSLQAMEMMAVSLIQPDGTKKAMKLNLDKSLLELRATLIEKGVSILSDDKFLTEMGEISPRDETQWTVREVIIAGNVLSFKPRRVALQEAPCPATPDTPLTTGQRNLTLYSPQILLVT